ncbi:MAG: SDR family oxidoreductase [Bacteroidota bacterium]
MSFDNKIVWITGASSGIGEGLAYAFSKEGAKLILSARRLDELERVKANCSGDGTNIFCIPLDLSDHEGLPAKADEALKCFGKIDYMVHNGGISQRSLAVNTSLDVDKKIMDVNYYGTIVLTKALLPGWIEKKAGHFVVISSVTGKVSTPLRTTYAASKHALHGFFDGLRAELTPYNIKVTLVCPGYVHTNVSLNALKGDGSKSGKMDPTTAAGLPTDVFARKMLKAVKGEKLEVYIGGKETLGVYIKRFFPSLAARIVAKMKFTS